MARTPRWQESDSDDGIREVRLSSWKYFSDYINQEMLDYTSYIYRGHGVSSWKLEPTLDRIIKSPNSTKRQEHLEAFKYSTRGRRGPNPALLESDNDWWALGQHHGLNTPLLDWTESPFVALFFAAESSISEKSKHYSVHAITQSGIDLINDQINSLSEDEIESINNRKPTVKIVKPLSDENSRLVSQRGLFTRGPNNMDLESWVTKYKHLDNLLKERILIVKIVIPTTGAKDCLRYLNRMNINNATLFPDLTGASKFCNKLLSIQKY